MKSLELRKMNFGHIPAWAACPDENREGELRETNCFRGLGGLFYLVTNCDDICQITFRNLKSNFRI